MDALSDTDRAFTAAELRRLQQTAVQPGSAGELARKWIVGRMGALEQEATDPVSPIAINQPG